jgi:two-component system, chemotaxis family, response regulator Rcp1
MTVSTASAPIEILLVEDSPADVRLTKEALSEARVRNNVSVCTDGADALDFLQRRGRHADAVTPDLILLDLNLPRRNGREVLEEIKRDERLRLIPVIILTTSEAEQDIVQSYALQASAYVTKPVELQQFLTAIKSIEGFWLEVVKLVRA